MKRLSVAYSYRLVGAVLVACLAASCLKETQSASASPPLSANDVTWLFPPPADAADLANLISIDDVTMQDPANPSARVPVWSDAAFKDFLAVADGPGASVDGTTNRIGLPPEARSKTNWFIAGIRIDPGAPGLKDEVTKVFGRRPQIRIILQPVKRQGGQVVDDFAAHLIFDFVKPPTPAEFAACPLHATPDDIAFQSVVDEVRALRDKLANGELGAAKVVTAGQQLNVQPGLANAATRANLTAQMKGFLQRQLSHAQLNAMALMGLPPNRGAPWIFVSLQRGKTSFGPVLSPTLSGSNQFAIEFTPGSTVIPRPHTNNEVAVTCMSAVFGPQASPVSLRKGVATADIFSGGAQDAATKTAIADRIANTAQSHFFNTDCISCHTLAQASNVNVPGISPDVMQQGPYDVHNFGWSIDIGLRGSVSRRTAAETADVVAWLNTNMPPR